MISRRKKLLSFPEHLFWFFTFCLCLHPYVSFTRKSLFTLVLYVDNILEHDRVRFVNIMDTSKWTSCVLCRRLCCLCLFVTGNIWLDESHGGCFIRSRNSLLFASTWDQPRYLGGVLLIFFICLRSVSCCQCCLCHWIVYTWLSILDCSFDFL
jgi:hypothetical protein